MTTDTDLRARLRDLADDAPHAGLSGDDLWRTGVRRQRLRRAASLTVAATAVAVVVALTSVVRFPSTLPPTQGPPELGIPRLVMPPDSWSEPTADPGPLAAISVANRTEPSGLTGSSNRLQVFGVSAVDGVSRFLDLPGAQINIDPGTVAISPDGTLVAVVRGISGPSEAEVGGWDLLDTETGDLTRLRVSDMPELTNAWGRAIAFSGDSRYLLTNFSFENSGKNRDNSLVAWDVETGERYVAEGPGHFRVPGRATGPSSVVWTRGHDVLTVDPATGDRATVSVPQQLVDASFSPDGETLAYVGHAGDRPNSPAPWRFHVRTGEGEVRQLDVGLAPGQILGWRDDTHVAVSRNGPRKARVVDIVTGKWERLTLQQEAGD